MERQGDELVLYTTVERLVTDGATCKQNLEVTEIIPNVLNHVYRLTSLI